MCVIIVCESSRPSRHTIQKCFDANPNGIGIAMRENGSIVYAKGLDVEKAYSISRKAPFPFVMHFRLASAGSADDYTLNHPFPITKSAFPTRYGHAERVLFHNGHVMGWEKQLFSFLNSAKRRFSGAWSDTRMVALAAHYYGETSIEALFPSQKFVIFDANTLTLIGDFEDAKDGMTFSNYFWKATARTVTYQGYYTGKGHGGIMHRKGGVENYRLCATCGRFEEYCNCLPSEEDWRNAKQLASADPSMPDRTISDDGAKGRAFLNGDYNDDNFPVG